MYKSDNDNVNILLEKLRELEMYKRIISLLNWDLETQMPGGGEELRSNDLAEISRISHNLFVKLNDNNLLDNLISEIETLSDDDQVIVLEIKKEYDKETLLSEELISNLSRAYTTGTRAWKEARELSKPELFLPHLKNIITLKKQVIESKGYAEYPYDALLDEYEPGLKTSIIEPILDEVRDFTIELTDKLKDSEAFSTPELEHQDIYIPRQKSFNDELSKITGFDFTKGASAISTHPFTNELSSNDVRFTSRYREKDFLYAVTSTMHETGHGLYEQNLPYKFNGTPLSQYISLGIHESQSRFYENQIGRSKEFSKLLSELSELHLGLEISDEKIFQYLNSVCPSLIRVEADELTYNLHIIIRFELEKEIFNNNLGVEEIETQWNKKYKQYFGLDVPNARTGFLQDVHWSQGLFGYFPTYTLGNLYSAQFARALKNEIDLESTIKVRDYAKLLNWFKVNIYQHGRRYSSSQLIQKVTGEPLSSKYLKERLTKKVDSIIALKNS